MALSRTELEAISKDPTIDEGSRQKAVALLNATEVKDDGTEYMLADAWRTSHALGQMSDQEYHGQFENARRTLKHKAFSVEAEAEPAKDNWIAAWGKNPFTGEPYQKA